MAILAGLERRSGSFGFSLSYIVVGVLAVHLAALVLPGDYFLPLANGAVFFLLFMQPLRRGDYTAAFYLALTWAVATTLVQIGLTVLAPELMARAVFNGPEYREEMFTWLRTGIGDEGELSRFLPIHVRHYAIFIVVSLLSGGLLGLMLGSAMLGWMNFYVGSLILAAGFAPSAIVLSWPLYSMVRVLAYLLTGAALAGVLLDRTTRGRAKLLKVLRWGGLGLLLAVLDLPLKEYLADVYRGILSRFITG